MPEWIEDCDDSQISVVRDSRNVGNYRSLRIWPTPLGWSFAVNGSFRGRRQSATEARASATAFAVQQIGVEHAFSADIQEF